MQKNKINFAVYRAYKNKGLNAKQLSEKTGIDYLRLTRLINGYLKNWRKKEMQILSKTLREPQKKLFG